VLIETSLKPGEVEIAVCDNGSGLPAGGAEESFTPFLPHTPDGLGMGLTIVEPHGGRVWAEQNEFSSAVFRVRLPLP
jgi:C4-dicarboxylate-specific signal transduction histidine kinase